MKHFIVRHGVKAPECELIKVLYAFVEKKSPLKSQCEVFIFCPPGKSTYSNKSQRSNTCLENCNNLNINPNDF